MITRTFIVVLLLIGMTNYWLHSEQEKPDISKPPPKTLQQDVSYVTTRIVTQQGGMGTGFFHIVDYTESDGTKLQSLLLISNKHVFYEPQDGIASVTEPSTKPSKEIIIAVNRRRKDGSPIFGNPKLIRDKLHDNPLYVEHPDPSIDIACLNVSKFDKDGYFRSATHQKYSRHFSEIDRL